MADTEKAPRSPKLSKSEITSVRLDPKLRYLAELAARKQRRSISSFIEWAVEDALNRYPISEGEDWSRSVMEEAESLWDVDEADRFAKLVFKHPELLSHEEQVLWKVIRENSFCWRGRYPEGSDEWSWVPKDDSLIMVRLRQHWGLFKAVAAGEQPHSSLPKVAKKGSFNAERSVAPAPAPTPRSAPAPVPRPAPPGRAPSGFDDMDDDIPF